MKSGDVNPGFARLRVLKLALDVIKFAVFDKFRSGLLEPERDIALGANLAEFHHPGKRSNGDNPHLTCDNRATGSRGRIF